MVSLPKKSTKLTVVKPRNYVLEKKTTFLHICVRHILFVVRVLGLFPVSGLRSSQHDKLKYERKSIHFVFSMISFLVHLFMTMLNISYMFIVKTSPRLYYKATINLSVTITMLTLMKLAKLWPSFVAKSILIEKTLPNLQTKNVALTCKLTVALVLILALVDFALGVNFYMQIGKACFDSENNSANVYEYTLSYLAYFIPYNPWTSSFFSLAQIQSLIILNFPDILIMMVSLYLTSLFKEFNGLLLVYRDKYPSIWNVLRFQYTNLSRLVKLVDDHVSQFVLLLFGSNMAIICVNFFKILRRQSAHDIDGCDPAQIKILLASFDRAIYYTFTVAFMIGRTLTTAILASRLHSTTKESIIILYEVPTHCYNFETHRFLEQMNSNMIALSGQRFFYVTQQMILTMAATILTYELVLLQFSDKK